MTADTESATKVVAGVEVHDLSVSYSHRPVLWAVDCDFSAGEITAIVGPNGAGKSTLLKSVLGFLPLSSGYVKIDGEDAEKKLSEVAYVPQREEVDWDFPVSVREVVMMARYAGLPFYKRPSRKDRDLVDSALLKVGMEDYSSRQISQLSGGQQQRVFLARALAQEASVYLLDEPFAGIDITTEEKMLVLLKELAASGATVVCVHHDLNTVSQYFDTALLLNVRKVAFGEAKKVLTQENIVKAYSGQPRSLSEVAERLKQRQFTKRER